MQSGIHQLLHGERDIVGGERRPIGENHAFAQLEGDGATVLGNAPRLGQLWFKLLGLAVQPHQHSASQIANSVGGVLCHQRRIEGLRLRAQNEVQLLCLGGAEYGQQAKQRGQTHGVSLHREYSFSEITIWQQLTTISSNNRGTKRHGWSPIAEKSSSSRSRLPHEGNGSLTPRPRIPRFASARMKTGIEIQNCAYRTGFRLGSMCTANSRPARQPAALACRTNSELRKLLVPEQTTRAEAAQPNSPNSENVISTEVVGAVLRGNTARTVMSRNSHGIDMNRSVNNIASFSQRPPK